MYGCGQCELVESMGVVSRMWVECMAVASGCGCKEVYRFPHITYPYSSCICSFLQQHPDFFIHFKKFFVPVPVLFVIKFYVFNNFFAQYKHILVTTGVPWQPYEGLHIMFYTRSTHKRTLHILRLTSAVCLQGAACRSRSRASEGVFYIEMHRGPHTC